MNGCSHALPAAVVAFPWPSTQAASQMLRDRMEARWRPRLVVVRTNLHQPVKS